VIFHFVLRGEGAAEITAAGVADAEHYLEKLVERHFPGCRRWVLEVRRTSADARLTEHFRVLYRMEVECMVHSDSLADARRTAFRQTRERVAGTELKMTKWERALLKEGTARDA
jgi:hypothetical protein